MIERGRRGAVAGMVESGEGMVEREGREGEQGW